MANLGAIQIKELTASGAVTVDGNPGQLLYVFFTGATAGDKLEILDGAVNRITMLVTTANTPVIFDPPIDARPNFLTDIDATITLTGAGYATFIYKEVGI